MKFSLKKTIQFLLPVLVVALAIFGAVILVKTRPVPQPRVKQEYAALVTVEPLRKTRQPVMLETSGTVIPAQSILLQARVSGEVLSMNEAFLPGGRVAAGEILLTLDPQDYQLALDLRKSEVEQASLALVKEQGMQTVALHEWELIDSREDLPDLQKELILRKPHLKAAQAALASAKASLRQAELNLERTDIRAPFDAVVMSKDVDVGAQVSSQTSLGQLAGTDEYWVEATVPVRDLHWLILPAGAGKKGSATVVKLEAGGPVAARWDGYVKKLDAQLEDQGRLARVLVAIPDPLEPSGDRTPLLLGSHVQVDIEGPVLEEVFVLPRSALHDGQYLWLMNAGNRLEIREIETVWGDDDVVVVRDGLQEGEQLVVSDLAVPAADLLLTTKLSAPAPPRDESKPGPRED